MNVNGINGNNAGVQSFQMNMNQGTDSVSKNLQSQIANALKAMQELGQDKEMSLEEKMKKRQEIQQQISDLQNQLRQHQIEQRKESQQIPKYADGASSGRSGRKKGSSMDDMLGGNKQASKSAKGGTGMSSASMQAIISADSSMNQVKVQGSVKTQMEGKAGVLESEIKLDAVRGDDVTKKKEELADIEAKAQDITASQMNSLSDINKKLEEAAKEDQKEEKAADKAEKSDETDKAKGTVRKDKATEADEHTEVQEANMETPENILPEGMEINVTEPIGNNVDVKL